MSARQNKKQRKGRNNANNRERTVTTLTEDPNLPFLVPTPSEEPAGGAILMSSPFSVASSSAGNQSSAYQMPSTYAFGFNSNNSFGPPMHGPAHHQQQQSQPQQQFYSPQQQQQQQQQQQPILLPPGQNDLEILEKLKDMIKNGQHEVYRPIPQPKALASLYLGPSATSKSQLVPHHPEQAPDFQYGNDASNPPPASGPSSSADIGRRPPRIQSKDGWDPTGQRRPPVGTQPTINVLSASSPTVSSPADSRSQTNQTYGNAKTNLAGPPSAGPQPIDVHMSDAPSSLTLSTTDGPGPISASPRSARFDGPPPRAGLPSGNINASEPRASHGESAYRGTGNISPSKSSVFDSKDDHRTASSRENGWSTRDAPPSEDRRREPDRDRRPPSPSSRSIVNGGGSDSRSNAGDRPRDDRYYDRDRDRDRDYRDRRDWDRDRRPYDRFRDNRVSDVRRPPPEQRHYEPDYARGPVVRRYDAKGPDEPVDARHAPPPSAAAVPVDDRVRGSDDRDRLAASARAPPPGDQQRAPADTTPRISHPDSRAPIPDSRVQPPPVRVRDSFDDRHAKPSPGVGVGVDERRLPPDDRSAVPVSAARPADVPGAVSGRPTPVDDVRTSPLQQSVDDRAPPRSQVPLEDRISRPSLQDRLSQPPSSRQPEPTSNHLTRQASLEERLSHIPVSADSRERAGRPPPGVADRDRDRASVRSGPMIDDRAGVAPPRSAPPPPQDDRARLDDRRYGRPTTPTPNDNRAAPYPPPRSDDTRIVKGPPSPPPSHRPAASEYRRPPPSSRPLSRERSDPRIGGGAPYRPDDRSYPDDRRSDAMDVDTTPARYGDSRAAPYRPFSPPSAADLARDRDRARAQFPSSPPRAPVPPMDAPPYDDLDRRYPTTAGRNDWQYQQQQYGNDRRREWSAAEEDAYYKSRPAQWDRSTGPPPPSASERDRFERDAPPPPVRDRVWDERDRREGFARPPSPSARSYDGPPRPLSSRLTDSYSSPAPSVANDRSYPPPPPRDGGGGAPPPSSFSRVRPRSPSPGRRPPGAPIDDQRPPMKRPRDDAYSSDYYPPPPSGGRSGDLGPPPLRRQGEYPPLPPRGGGSPPPSSGGSSYFDNRSGPPPSSAGTTTTSAGPGGDRDYPPPPPSREYPVPAYERARSPGPPRGGYSRSGYPSRDGRDDRRYLPPPPLQQSMLPPPGRR
ncbi:hypothetical protein Hypma_002392 [Hypsizygus marmoreus]|uniref:Uncharacterized protein n=1 Tax=Hypsizygus marmoreus TaxID=39966 RepID=A0A369JBX4_HYPMA|nr:hypothetical protein Hypma_002392 [Hypsizygus marmoreus]